jgi:hypothetical protein
MTQNIETSKEAENRSASRFSLDTWAVFLALGLSFLIWIGVIKHVPW